MGHALRHQRVQAPAQSRRRQPGPLPGRDRRFGRRPVPAPHQFVAFFTPLRGHGQRRPAGPGHRRRLQHQPVVLEQRGRHLYRRHPGRGRRHRRLGHGFRRRRLRRRRRPGLVCHRRPQQSANLPGDRQPAVRQPRRPDVLRSDRRRRRPQRRLGLGHNLLRLRQRRRPGPHGHQRLEPRQHQRPHQALAQRQRRVHRRLRVRRRHRHPDGQGPAHLRLR